MAPHHRESYRCASQLIKASAAGYTMCGGFPLMIGGIFVLAGLLEPLKPIMHN